MVQTAVAGFGLEGGDVAVDEGFGCGDQGGELHAQAVFVVVAEQSISHTGVDRYRTVADAQVSSSFNRSHRDIVT